MTRRLEWGQVTVPALYLALAAIALYFVHTGMQGERGLTALRDAERSKAALEAELAELQSRHNEIANRVSRLSNQNLDLELLDERARDVLGYVRTDEMVIR